MNIKRRWILLFSVLMILLSGCNPAPEPTTAPQPVGETYRNVKVTSVSGEAVLIRNEIGQSVYRGMLVNGDDCIETQGESSVDLLLDGDKYARIYEHSRVSFRLEGDTVKGAIRIYLDRGGIHNKIENRLSEFDSYEIHTPDAVMAVRGTEWEVLITQTDRGRETQINTKSGSVEITLQGEGGEKKMSEAGDTTTVRNTFSEDGQPGTPEFAEETPPENPNPPAPPAPIVCVNCKNTLAQGQTHLLSCSANHFSCDGKDHSVCTVCQKNVCVSPHLLFECKKHYQCSLEEQESVVHSMYCVVCKTYACSSQKTHTWAECGCVSCTGNLGGNHISCDVCGRCKSNNLQHGECSFCYGCTGDGEMHGKGICQLGPG